jgi:hypothetical protein
VATTSQPLLLEQATFSLRLLSQWTSWSSLVVVVVVAIEPQVAVLVVIELALELRAVVQVLRPH